MRGIRSFSTVVLMLAIGAASAGAAELEDVVAKHVAAKGGDGWDAIRTIKATGSYTAVSVVEPFTLQKKKRDNKYVLDYVLIMPRREGFDGANAWSQRGEVPQLLGGVGEAVVVREADFLTPLFDYEERGFELELLGEVDFDGLPAIGVSVSRGDGKPETWYLDPDTYLELGRESVGVDYIGEVPRVTFYDDFREVQGVQVPFYVESQWMTRQRVMEIDTVEFNLPVDDAVFVKPPPPGMVDLAQLAGTWKVTLAQRDGPEDEEWRESERESTIADRMGGGMLQESYRTGSGAEVERTISYDRFNEKYRVTRIDSSRSQMDVQEGASDGNGRITVSNAETGTAYSSRGTTYHGRMSIFGVTGDGFEVEYETSTDGGESWFVDAKASYVRVE